MYSNVIINYNRAKQKLITYKKKYSGQRGFSVGNIRNLELYWQVSVHVYKCVSEIVKGGRK